MTVYRRLVVCEDETDRFVFLHSEVPSDGKIYHSELKWVLNLLGGDDVIVHYAVIHCLGQAHKWAAMDFTCIDYRFNPDEDVRAFLDTRVRWVVGK
jgi:hypothetical protein